MTKKQASSDQLTDEDYQTLAAIRAALRRFMHFSEDAAMRVGDTIHFFLDPSRRHRCYPVVDPATQKLVGMISRADLIKLRWKEFEAETVREAQFRRRHKQKGKNVHHQERWIFDARI